MRSREALWEDSYEEKQAKIASAAAQTKGMYMTWEGQIIEPAYFWLSAGKTRNGKEVFGEGYDYLTSVDCSHDIEASGSVSYTHLCGMVTGVEGDYVYVYVRLSWEE